MKIQTKIALVLALVAGLCGAVQVGIQHFVLRPQFLTLETDEALEDMNRCRAAILEELRHLTLFCRDWSSWDDPYNFVVGKNPHFITSSLVPESFQSANANLIHYYDHEGQLYWGRAYDLRDLTTVEIPELDQAILRDPLIARQTDVKGQRCGFIRTALGPMMIASLPVLTSTQEGPINGTLVVGRLLSPEVVAEISSRTSVSIVLRELGKDELPPLAARVASASQFSNEASLQEFDANLLSGFLHFCDVNGAPLFQLEAQIPRMISDRGNATLRFASWSLFCGGLVLLCFLQIVMHYVVSRPLKKLSAHITEIGASNDLTRRAQVTSNDEVGCLAIEFNNMADRLADSHRKLVGLSRQAGMSQVATGVLHNIGNVLASVNCVADSLRTKVQSSKMHRLTQLSTLLTEHADDLPKFIAEDPRGQQILPYVQQLASRWQEEGGQLQADVQTLLVNVQHVTTVVEAQQRHANRAQVRERAKVESLITEANLLCQRSLEKHGVALELNVTPNLPQMLVDRAEIAQVLVNLITNAKDAVLSAGPAEPCIRVSASEPSPTTVRIDIADNGIGINPEIATKMFQNGFTTKAHGHGYGLHYCQLTIQRMGGALTVHSEGEGQGATFSIELPVSEAEASSCAPATHEPELALV